LPPRLASAQRDLLRWLVAPEGVERALADEGEGAAARLAALVRGSGELSAEVRLGVYSHAYFARIHAALRNDFSALARALGAAAFHDLVKLYLVAHPPRHWSLRYVGDRLADFVGAHAAAGLFRARWPFAGDLAALEWALLDAFDAADASPLAREDLAAVPAESWGDLRLRPGPGLALLRLGWPVHRLRERLESEELPALAPEATAVAVWRQGERVFYRALPADEADALAGLVAGERFGELCERVERHAGDGAARRALELLERWIADGWLTRAGAGA
jgi:hypothetical protein